MSIVGKLENENTVKQLDLEPGIQFKDQSDPLFLGTLELRINTKVAARATPKVLGLFLSRKSNMSYLFLFEKNNEISFPI